METANPSSGRSSVFTLQHDSAFSLRRLIDVIIGMVLITFATGKLFTLFQTPILGDGDHLVSAAILSMEYFFGLSLLLDSMCQRKTAFLACVFMVFSTVSAWKVAVGEASCGCAGNSVKMPPFVSLLISTFSASFLILSLSTRLPSCTIGNREIAMRIAISLFMCFSIFYWSTGEKFQAGSQAKLVSLDGSDLLGKRFPFADELSKKSNCAKGSWLVVFVNPDCQQCDRYIGQFRTSDGVEVAGQTVERVLIISQFQLQFKDIENQVVFDSFKPGKKWFYEAKLSVLYVNGIGKAVVAPEQVTFKGSD